MAKHFTLALATFFALTIALQPSRASALGATTQLEQLKNFDELSREELQQGFAEIKESLSVLKQDLLTGQETQDHHHYAIKARNISLRVAGLSILAAMGFLASLSSTQMASHIGVGVGLGISLTVLLGSVVTTVATEGYVYLTQKEVDILQTKIEKIEKKIALIQLKLVP